MQTSPQNGAAYRPDIDGLRAIAVLAVVFYHAAIPGFSGGFVGVDIFFVISGYLITRIIWIESNTGAFSLPGFYIRRIKRIFPALFALLFISSMAAVILLVSSDLLQYGKLLTGVVLFFANFALIKQSNYFDAPAADKPLLHTWSLSVEEQFYAAWPLILLLLKNNISRRNTLYVIAGLAVISLVLAEARLPDYQKDAFYLPWCRAWELLLGAFLAINQLSLHPGRFADSLSMTGICGIGFAIALYDGSTPFPGLAALLPCMGATLIVAAGNSSNPVSRFLSWGPLRFVGLISYSLYLIHWPLFSFSRLYFGEELAPPFRGALVVISFALASLSWRFVEKPWRAAKFSNWRTFSMAVAAMGCFCICGYWFTSSGGLPFRLHEKVLKVEALTNDIAKYCRALDIPEGRGGLACELGAPSIAGYDFVLWGDSHAYHFAPAIHKLAERRDLSGVLFTRWGCHPFLNDPHTSKDCQKFNALVASWIDRNPIKLAILGGRWTNHDKYLRQSVERGDPATDEGGLAKTLSFLTNKGIMVSVLDQVPDFPQDVRLCVARALMHGQSMRHCVIEPEARFQSRHRVLTDYFAVLKQQFDFSVATSAHAMCDVEECHANRGETLLIVDNNHLSEAGALYVMSYLDIPLLSLPATSKDKDPASPLKKFGGKARTMQVVEAPH